MCTCNLIACIFRSICVCTFDISHCRYIIAYIYVCMHESGVYVCVCGTLGSCCSSQHKDISGTDRCCVLGARATNQPTLHAYIRTDAHAETSGVSVVIRRNVAVTLYSPRCASVYMQVCVCAIQEK